MAIALTITFGMAVLIFAGTALGFLPLIATLVSFRGQTSRIIKLGMAGALLCSLLALVVSRPDPTVLDIFFLFGSSLCMVAAFDFVSTNRSEGSHAGVVLGDREKESLEIVDSDRSLEALRESERSLRELVETLPTMIYCATPEGKPIYRSRKLQEYLGFRVEDKDGIRESRLEGTLDAIIHPDDIDLVRQRYAYSLRTGEPYLMKHRLRRYDGEYRWVETRTAPMRNVEGVIIQWNGVCVDIDDWVRDQEQLGVAQQNLARASQAASLAELTASIAHEVGQPLAAIVSSSDASQRWLSADPPNVERALKALERVVRSAETTTDVFKRVRALFKHTNEAKQPSSVEQVISSAKELVVEEAVRRNVQLEVAIEPDLPTVLLDRVQIQQVLVNLIRNGMEAGHIGAGRPKVSITANLDGNTIRIRVRDSGPGLASVDQVFEPFFTTKADGMGMGLAICKSIVEAHGGRLWAENAEPTGAAFIFMLPLDSAASEPKQKLAGHASASV
ncbi:ATP-binding protein [Rhizobium sp. GCM10022189]|uniref:ATP-binding protein n=1 Tax=Rhizobium sp. GCM10022189 TaxID=3252654 RepID=UPI003620E71B